MTGYDLTEAIREASDHLHADSCPEDMCGCRCGHYDREAEIALTAALPHIEKQIRERVAAKAWDEGAQAAWERSSPEVNGQNYYWRSDGEPVNPYRARTRKDTDHA